MYDSIRSLNTELEAAKERVSKEAKNAIGAAFKELFEKFPEIKAIQWDQYTPYFNDGSPCDFSVNAFYFTTKDINENDFCFGDPDDEDQDEGWKYISSYRGDSDSPEAKAINELVGLIPDEAMLAAFGDHTKILASREGFRVEEYSHD